VADLRASIYTRWHRVLTNPNPTGKIRDLIINFSITIVVFAIADLFTGFKRHTLYCPAINAVLHRHFTLAKATGGRPKSLVNVAITVVINAIADFPFRGLDGTKLVTTPLLFAASPFIFDPASSYKTSVNIAFQARARLAFWRDTLLDIVTNPSAHKIPGTISSCRACNPTPTAKIFIWDTYAVIRATFAIQIGPARLAQWIWQLDVHYFYVRLFDFMGVAWIVATLSVFFINLSRVRLRRRVRFVCILDIVF
jgi:hypothetical protein